MAVTVLQDGKPLFQRTYGWRSSPKVWGYPYGGHPGSCQAIVADSTVKTAAVAFDMRRDWSLADERSCNLCRKILVLGHR